MLYILDQRLRAQSIPDEKARKGKRMHMMAATNMASFSELIYQTLRH